MKPSIIPDTSNADLWLESPAVEAVSAEFGCRLDLPDGESHRIWFRFQAAVAPMITRNADPFVVAVLLYAMKRCRKLVVHGPLSPSLVSNLSDFQSAFCAHHENTYHHISIESDQTARLPTTQRPDRAIAAFSGGVDGTFSVYRHTGRSKITPKRPLHAALLMQGMDVALDQTQAFSRVTHNCSAVAEDAGIRLFTGATNVRELPLPWEDQFGSAVAASLLFFQETYTQGLIASAYSYGSLHADHGSNPLTDPLLSSGLLTIVHDGADYGRIEKLRQLASWPKALAKLRVCWQPGRSDNCGQCEKCIRTQLMLDLCGVHDCPAFPGHVSTEDLDNLTIHTDSGVNELSYLLHEARLTSPRAPWIGPLARAIDRNKRYRRLQDAARKAGSFIPGWLRASAGAVAKHLFAQNGRRKKITPEEPRQGIPVTKASL